MCREHHVKCQAGWITSWNRDCWEKYQQPQICRWYHSNGRKWRGTKESPNESEKAGLKFSIQKTMIMPSSPVPSWQIDWEKVETVADFIFLVCKITVDSHCSHKIKICLLLGRKAMTKLDSALKSRHNFTNKDPYSKSYGFSSSHVQKWELDHEEGKHQRKDAFELWYWWVPWTARRSNPLTLKEMNP